MNSFTSIGKNVASVLFSKGFLLTGLLVLSVFAGLMTGVSVYLRSEIRGQILNRDAELIYSVSLLEFATQPDGAESVLDSDEMVLDVLLTAAARTAKLRGVFGVELFLPDGKIVDVIPQSLVSAELDSADLELLRQFERIRRFHLPANIGERFTGVASFSDVSTLPLLEIIVPLHFPDSETLKGIVRYWIDGQAVSDEFRSLDQHLTKQFAAVLGGGGCIILLILAWSFYRLIQTNRLLEHRSLKLKQANRELTLAAKTSAVGAITAHLVHGLKNPIFGLKEFFSKPSQHADPDQNGEDWETANLTISRMDDLVQDLVSVLREEQRGDHYEMSSQEICQFIRAKFKGEMAAKDIDMDIACSSDFTLPNRETNCVLMILQNLSKNAIEATPPGGQISVSFHLADATLTVQLKDNGPGLPREQREDPFKPILSRKPNGSGIGLAISYQLARHIQADLHLVHTGREGTCFELTLPLDVSPSLDLMEQR